MIGSRVRLLVSSCGLAASLVVGGCAQLEPPPAAQGGGAPPAQTDVPPVTRVPVEGAGYLGSITLSPDGDRAYVVGSDGLAVLDTATWAVLATVTAPGAAGFRGVGVTPDGSRVYLPTSDGIDVLDANTNTVVSRIPLGARVTDVAVAPDGRRLYAVSESSGQVAALDAASGAVQAVAQVDEEFDGKRLALSPDGATLRVSASTGLVELDTSSLQVTRTVPVPVPNQGAYGSQIVDVVTSQDGARTYFSTVFRVGVVEDGRLAQEIETVDHSPGGLALSPDGTRLVAAGHGMGGADCSVIDTRAGSVITTFDLGHASDDVAFSPEGDLAYAIDYSRAISVVDIRALAP
jgi:DNA-binding beta-propeller fold protein YncE